MYHITYQFNENTIITFTAKAFVLVDDTLTLTSRKDDIHTLPADTLISIVPVRNVRRRATTPKKD